MVCSQEAEVEMLDCSLEELEEEEQEQECCGGQHQTKEICSLVSQRLRCVSDLCSCLILYILCHQREEC